MVPFCKTAGISHIFCAPRRTAVPGALSSGTEGRQHSALTLRALSPGAETKLAGCKEQTVQDPVLVAAYRTKHVHACSNPEKSMCIPIFQMAKLRLT